jgi:hypothetical protein
MKQGQTHLEMFFHNCFVYQEFKPYRRKQAGGRGEEGGGGGGGQPRYVVNKPNAGNRTRNIFFLKSFSKLVGYRNDIMLKMKSNIHSRPYLFLKNI